MTYGLSLNKEVALKQEEMQRPDSARSDAIGREGPSRLGTLTPRTLLLTVAFVVSACTGGAQALGADDGEATLNFVAPADGGEVSIPFDLTVESSVSLGPPDSGNHHLHLFFDGGTDAADYDIVYGSTAQVSRELAPGEHTIIVSLRSPDHSDAGMSDVIKVVVTGRDGIDRETTDPAARRIAMGTDPGVAMAIERQDHYRGWEVGRLLIARAPGSRSHGYRARPAAPTALADPG